MHHPRPFSDILNIISFNLATLTNYYIGSNNDDDLSIQYNTMMKMFRGVSVLREGDNVEDIRKRSRMVHLPPKYGVLLEKINISRDDGSDLEAIWLKPFENDKEDKVFLHFHGGGMVIGEAEVEAPAFSELVNYLHIKILSVNYRLLPENSIRDAVEDGVTAYKFLTKKLGYKSQNIIITGCSAGGAMSIHTTLQLIALQETDKDVMRLGLPAGIIALSPSVNTEVLINKTFLEFESAKLPDEKSILLPVESALFFRSFLKKDPDYAEFLRGIYSHIPKLPPTYVVIGEYEVTYGSMKAFTEVAKQRGANIEVHSHPKMFHCYILGCMFNVPESIKLVHDMGDWASQKLA